MQHLSLKFAIIPENGQSNEPETSIFDDSGFKVEMVDERRTSQSPEREKNNIIKDRIKKAMELISALNTDGNINPQWKSAPLIWELLSFRDEEITGASTPLSQLINEASTEVPSIYALDLDQKATLIEDIDDVIHQTYFRRRAILAAISQTIKGNLSDSTAMEISTMVRRLTTTLESRRLSEDCLPEAVETCRAAAKEKLNQVTEITIRPFRPGLKITSKDITVSSLEESLNSNIGDVYLVRSPQVNSLGDHFVLMIGGFVRRPHGMRPDSIAFGPIPEEEDTPLKTFDRQKEGLILLKLSDQARQAFYKHYEVEEKLRKK